MIDVQKDRATGIIRYECNTVSPDDSRASIEAAGFVGVEEGENIRYRGAFRSFPVEILSTPTRTIMYSTSEIALLETYTLIDGDSWTYDESKRYDYVPEYLQKNVR